MGVAHRNALALGQAVHGVAISLFRVYTRNDDVMIDREHPSLLVVVAGIYNSVDR